MKNKLYFFILLFILTTKIQGQEYDTIVVYDTIMEYDTVIVYDTIKEFENNLMPITSPQQTVLELDSSASKMRVMVFNEKDTATIPVDSIIVSETNKNSQTMKKLKLTLAASALLSQIAIGQESKITNENTSANTDSIWNYKDSVAAISEGKTQAYSIETVVFQKKNKPEKTYEITLPATNCIRFKNLETIYALLDTLNTSINLYPRYRRAWRKQLISNFYNSIITHIDDSLVTIKFGSLNKNIGYYNTLRKIKKDKSLSKEEKGNIYFNLTYTDSVVVPLKYVKSFKISRFNNKNKKFYNWYNGYGFNEQEKEVSVRINTILAALVSPFLIPVPEPEKAFFNPDQSLRIKNVLFFLAGGYAICLSTICLSEELTHKRISLKRWEIKK